MSFTLCLEPSAESRPKAVVHAYYEYVKEKRDVYCDDLKQDRTVKREERALQRCEDGEFYIGVYIQPAVHENITWNDVLDPSGGWLLSNDDTIEELTSKLRDAMERANEQSDGTVDYTCSTQAGPIAVCEFALKHGHAVQVLDS